MLKCFRYEIKGKKYYVVTDKKIANKTDAIKILNLYTSENNIPVKDFGEKMIEASINTIKSGMILCDVRINENGLSFTEKFGGGYGEKIIKNNVGKFYITE